MFEITIHASQTRTFLSKPAKLKNAKVTHLFPSLTEKVMCNLYSGVVRTAKTSQKHTPFVFFGQLSRMIIAIIKYVRRVMCRCLRGEPGPFFFLPQAALAVHTFEWATENGHHQYAHWSPVEAHFVWIFCIWNVTCVTLKAQLLPVCWAGCWRALPACSSA